MSRAMRAAWDDSMRFELCTLPRWAVSITVVSTITTTASTTSVIISSTSVNPRCAGEWLREGRVMGSQPHVGSVDDRALAPVPAHVHRDPFQVVERGGQHVHVVEAQDGPAGEGVAGRSGRM